MIKSAALPADLAESLRQRVRLMGGRAVACPSRWAEKHRTIRDKPFDFVLRPWSRAFHDSLERKVVIKKAAQMSATEAALNRVFYTLHVLRLDVLYLLPTFSPDASDFSAARIKPAIAESETLRALFYDADNVGHKRAGIANLYVRGTNSTSGLRTIPVAFIIFDEYDEMDHAQVRLAQERTSGQESKWEMMLSTPSLPVVRSIDAEYKLSDQRVWACKCPGCSQFVVLEWPKAFVYLPPPDMAKSHRRCPKCRKRWGRDDLIAANAAGAWVARRKGGEFPGFWISQLNSPFKSDLEIADSWRRALELPEDEKEFFNSTLGLAHLIRGARLDLVAIQACIEPGRRSRASAHECTLGVDVGNWLHWEAAQWPQGDEVKVVVAVGKASSFEELDAVMEAYAVYGCVIDSQPERRKAVEFMERYGGRVYLARYPGGEMKDEVVIDAVRGFVDLNRTVGMDVTLGRYRIGHKRVVLPYDLPQEYAENLCALVRDVRRDKRTGEHRAFYVDDGPDHWAHAALYGEAARALFGTPGPVEAVREPAREGEFALGDEDEREESFLR